MEETCRIHRVESVSKGYKSTALREKHQQPIKAFEKVGISFGF